jgi:hypothetical protein
MRGAVPLLLLAGALSASSATGEPSPPYTAFVTGTNVYVRSGPGMNYYPTDKLQPGDQVEVYRHDPGGWYAIRPPRNSFSWVSARHVEKTADGLGRASDDQAVVRVGSRLSNVRDTVQVRLDPGEPVEILKSFNAGGQTWYKIASPSGEFRWMYGRYLSTTPADPRPSSQQPEALAAPPPVPPKGITATSPPPPPVPPKGITATSPPQTLASTVNTPAARRPPAEPANVAVAPPASSPVAPPRRDEWQSRGQPRPEGQSLQDRNSVPAPVSPRPWQADRPALPGRQPSEGNPQPLGAAQTAPSTATGDQVARLERQLSIIVAEDPTTWQFEELRRVASRLLVNASTAPERGRVRQVLGKISRFEEIQQRRVQMGLAPTLANRGQAATPGIPPAPATGRLAANPSRRRSWLSRGSNQLPGTAANPSPFDGVGTLRPVVSRRRNTPRYALVDNAGQVVSFVTPGPGVNLQPYLGRKIGIRGNRGYLPELRQTNVMARRITALDPGLVR